MRARWRPFMQRGFDGVRARYPAPAGARSCTSPLLLIRGAEASGETRSSDFIRTPAEWRIGSPVIEAAWYETAHTERNNGVGHGTPSGAMPGRLCSLAIPTMARWESTNRLFSGFADGQRSQTVRHSRKIGWEGEDCPILGLRASGFRSIALPDQRDKQRRREFRP